MERDNRDLLDFIIFLSKNTRILFILLVFSLLSSFYLQNTQKGLYKAEVEIFILQSHNHYLNINNYLTEISKFRPDVLTNKPRITAGNTERLVIDLLKYKLIVRKLAKAYISQNDGVEDVTLQIKKAITGLETAPYHFIIRLESENKEMVSFIINNIEEQVLKYIDEKHNYLAAMELQNSLLSLNRHLSLIDEDNRPDVTNQRDIFSTIKIPSVSAESVEFYSTNIIHYFKYRPVILYTLSVLISVLLFFLIVIIKDLKHQISFREH